MLEDTESVVALRSDKDILGYSRWVVLIAAFFSMCLISPYEYAWSSISPFFSERFGWPLSRIELVFSLFVIFQSGASFPAGILRDRYGPRLLTIVSGIIAAIGVLALTSSRLNLIMIAFGVIGSFAVGVIYSNAVNTANKWFPDKRGLTAGLIAGGFSWGSIPFVFWIRGGASVQTYPQFLWKISLIVGVIIVICGYFLKDPPKGWIPQGYSTPKKRLKRPCNHQFTLKETLSTWQLWVLFISFSLIAGTGLMAISKIVRYAQHLGFEAVVATAAGGGLAFTNGLGRPILGGASDRFGRENTMVFSFVLCGLLTIGIYIFGKMGLSIGFIICILGALFFWGPVFSLFPAICGHYYGEDYAASNYGALYLAKLVGGVYGGWVSALVIEHFGFDASFILGGIMGIAGGLMVLFPRYKPPVWETSMP
jgi:OFA family oxalate/formate antiporter-like MFS transporter